MDSNTTNIITNLAEKIISHDKSGETIVTGHELTLLFAVVGIIFKTSIEKFVASLFVFFGNDYNEDDYRYDSNNNYYSDECENDYECEK